MFAALSQTATCSDGGFPVLSFDDIISAELSDDADTIPAEGDVSSELLDAVEWLKEQGYLTREERPFASLLKDAE